MTENRCINCMRKLDAGVTVCPYCGFDRSQYVPSEMALPPGCTLANGKYLIGRTLGQGGFGVTYAALDQFLELRVAIKEYLPRTMAYRSGDSTSLHWHSSVLDRQSGRESFIKEAKKMARIDQIPGVVRVKEVFYENETAYIVMDYVEGETLLHRLQRTGPLDGKACLELLRPVMDALSEAHRQGLIHRDVSPDNIMLDRRNRVWLLDMGAAKELDMARPGGGHNSTTMVVKPGFSPLEQYASGGDIGPWTDVYAMSATIFYCMSGSALPLAPDRVLNPRLELPEVIPSAVAQVLLKGLALRPEERTRSMEELRDAFAVAVGAADNAQARQEQEEARRREEERQQAEEARRREEERQQAEEAQRREEERRQAEEARRQEEERQRMEQKKQEYQRMLKESKQRAQVRKAEQARQEESRQKKGNALLIIPAVIIVVIVVGALVFSSKCGDNARWKLNRDGLLTISGSGEMEDFATASGGLLNLRVAPWDQKQVNNVEIKHGITTIGSCAFYECTNLTNVTIPDSVTSIGHRAFADCKNLLNITIPDGVTVIREFTFYWCENLTNVIIPSSVTRIGNDAFASCNSLTSVTIPDSVTTIGEGAFMGCDSLTSVTIPDSVTSIGEGAFYYCDSLSSVSVPAGARIGVDAFPETTVVTIRDGEIELTEANISSSGECGENAVWTLYEHGLLYISGSGEMYDYNVDYTAESASSDDIPWWATREEVDRVIIQLGIRAIGTSAFENCMNLTDITIPVSVTSIGENAFCACYSLAEVTIPDGVETIGEYAFAGCDSLTSVTIPDSVTTIESDTFFECDNLTSVTIPDSVTSIGSEAFHSCVNLTSVTIPDSVTTIGGLAFAYCDSLTSVSVPADAEIAEGAFPETTTVIRR